MLWLFCIFVMACVVALVAHYWMGVCPYGGGVLARMASALAHPGSRSADFYLVVDECREHAGHATAHPAHRGGSGSGAWGQALMTADVFAAVPIICFWAVLSFESSLTGLFKRAKNTDDLLLAGVISAPVLLLLVWVCGYAGGYTGAGIGLFLWIWPLTHYALMVSDFRTAQPAYSLAIAKMKFGKYADAEKAILAQLEKSESDFDGWMMLAELYSNQFQDLAEAEKTICDLCDEETTTPSQMSIAMHRLADWQLNLRQDPVSARRILEELCRRLPNTHLATMARHRINQLPSSSKELLEQQKTRTVAMPAQGEPLDAAPISTPIPVSPEDALAKANQLVEQLKQDPNDIVARERLAKTFAEQMGQTDLAVEQLELLIGMPGQSPAKTAEWLGLMAEWILEQRGEGETVQKILERLIHDFPQTPQAFNAQRRLSLMRMKTRGRRTQTV